MSSFESLSNDLNTLFKVWYDCSWHPVSRAYIGESIYTTIVRIEKVFRDNHGLPGGVVRDELVNASEEEQIRYLKAGKNVLNISAPYVKPRKDKPKYIDQDNALVNLRPDSTQVVVYESLAWTSYICPDTKRRQYEGLSVQGLLVKPGTERLIELMPVFVPLEHMQVLSRPA